MLIRYCSSALLLAIVFQGCSSPTEHEPPASEAGLDVAIPDVWLEEDAGSDPDVSCETPGEEEAPVEFSVGEQRFPFSNAGYGMIAPVHNESQEWQLHVELWEGGYTGCPEEGSPTPARTVIVSGLPMLSAVVGYTENDGVNLVFLDYTGEIVDDLNPTSKASTLIVRPLNWSLCVECVGEPVPSHEAGEVVLQVEGIFAEGTLRGTLKARHCDSLDLP